MENSIVIDTLNELIEVSRDGEAGFATCANDVKNPSLKAYFTICATRCRESVRVLTGMVERYHGQPATSGTVVGSAHRAWVNLRAALESDDDLAVLEECERGEDSALRAYRKALEKTLPTDVNVIIQRQYEGLKDNHDRIRDMRDEKKRAAA